MFSSILVPIDFSEGSAHALELAIRLAVEMKARLTLLHVCVPEGIVVLDPYNALAAHTLPEVNAEAEANSRDALTALGRERVPPSVPWHVLTRLGDVPDAIVDATRTGGFDVVVIGTHGRTGLSRVVLGSIAERVVRTAEVPVLVTR